MIIQFHTPNGVVEVDSETATNTELATLGMYREDLEELMPRDLAAKIDGMNDRLLAVEEKLLMSPEGGNGSNRLAL